MFFFDNMVHHFPCKPFKKSINPDILILIIKMYLNSSIKYGWALQNHDHEIQTNIFWVLISTPTIHLVFKKSNTCMIYATIRTQDHFDTLMGGWLAGLLWYYGYLSIAKAWDLAELGKIVLLIQFYMCMYNFVWTPWSWRGSKIRFSGKWVSTLGECWKRIKLLFKMVSALLGPRKHE